MKTFKEWFQKREWGDEPSVEGEYWIDDSGDVQYADGDIGDLNHEGIAIETAQGMISGGGDENWEEFKNQLAQRVYQNRLSATTDAGERQTLTDDFEDDPLSFIDEDALEQEGIDLELFQVANGRAPDARTYAMKTWGWKKVIGQDVETWTFDKKDQSILARGLGEIVYQSGIEDEEANQIEFHVYCFGNNQSYDVTIPQLEGIKTPTTPVQNYQQTQMPQQPAPTQAPGAFTNFINQQPPQSQQPEIPQPYKDEDDAIRVRPGDAHMNLMQRAANNYGYDQDRSSMPKYYKGRLGDWHHVS
jgi:hypothetical protein